MKEIRKSSVFSCSALSVNHSKQSRFQIPVLFSQNPFHSKQHFPIQPRNPLLFPLLQCHHQPHRLLQLLRRNKPPICSLRCFFSAARGDVSVAGCAVCVSTATQEALQRCSSKVAMIWYDECMIRYSNQSFLGVADYLNGQTLRDTQDVANPTHFEDVKGELLNGIALRGTDGDPAKKFAVGEANVSFLQKLYGLAQRTPDLTSSDCNYCLFQCINFFAICCVQNPSAWIIYPNCNVGYELYPFYNAIAVAPPPPPLSPPPPPSQPSPPPPSLVVVAIFVPIGVSLLCIILLAYCLISRMKKPIITEDDPVGAVTAGKSIFNGTFK